MKLTSGVSLYTKIVFTDVRTKDGFTLFPNPAKNEIFISFSEMNQINLFSITGEKLKVNLQKINNNQVKIDTSSLQPGVYVVKAANDQR